VFKTVTFIAYYKKTLFLYTR